MCGHMSLFVHVGIRALRRWDPVKVDADDVTSHRVKGHFPSGFFFFPSSQLSEEDADQTRKRIHFDGVLKDISFSTVIYCTRTWKRGNKVYQLFLLHRHPPSVPCTPALFPRCLINIFWLTLAANTVSRLVKKTAEESLKSRMIFHTFHGDTHVCFNSVQMYLNTVSLGFFFYNFILFF